jgi:hypothetical protein
MLGFGIHLQPSERSQLTFPSSNQAPSPNRTSPSYAGNFFSVSITFISQAKFTEI